MAGSEAGVYVSYSDSAGYRLLRNGIPFKIRGASGHQRMELLKEYGGNTVRVYDPDSLGAVLARAERLDLAVIADLPLPYYHRVGEQAAEDIRQITPEVLDIVDAHRGHPALLYWILGNELFNKGYSGEFADAYNELVSAIRNVDPIHPISSTFNVHQLAYSKIRWKQPDIDFVSFNLFGGLPDLTSDLRIIWPIWRGAFVLTEWGYNGPWEANMTRWDVPVEPPNANKAQQLRQRYEESLIPLHDNDRMMGDLTFFWGNKFETTPTWFSYFTPAGHRSEMAHTLGQLWTNQQEAFPGPSVEYLLVNGNGQGYNHLLSPGTEALAEVKFKQTPDTSATVEWEIREEDWQNRGSAQIVESQQTEQFSEQSADRAVFRVPDATGPYRIYYRVSTAAGYFTAANLPFYVVSPDDAE